MDSVICGELKFDIFAHMKEQDYWQGYLAEDTWDSCAERLTDAIQRQALKTSNILTAPRPVGVRAAFLVVCKC